MEIIPIPVVLNCQPFIGVSDKETLELLEKSIENISNLTRENIINSLEFALEEYSKKINPTHIEIETIRNFLSIIKNNDLYGTNKTKT